MRNFQRKHVGLYQTYITPFRLPLELQKDTKIELSLLSGYDTTIPTAVIRSLHKGPKIKDQLTRFVPAPCHTYRIHVWFIYPYPGSPKTIKKNDFHQRLFFKQGILIIQNCELLFQQSQTSRVYMYHKNQPFYEGKYIFRLMDPPMGSVRWDTFFPSQEPSISFHSSLVEPPI